MIGVGVSVAGIAFVRPVALRHLRKSTALTIPPLATVFLVPA